MNGQANGTVSVGVARGALQGQVQALKRNSAVAAQLERGKTLGAQLHELIDQIANRVQAVRTVQPPSAGTDAPGEPVAATDLAQEIQALNGTLAEGNRRLQILLDSIDL